MLRFPWQAARKIVAVYSLAALDALLLVKGWVAGSSAGDGVPVLGSVKVVHPVGCST
jgi:hypothetical protein